MPLLAGALMHTFAPRAGPFFGSFTGALFQGALPILAVFYVCVGAAIPVRSLGQVVKRGGALLGTKIALGIAAGVILGHFLGNDPVRAGWFAGVSTLAVVAALNDTNGGLYMALMNQYGTAEETAAYSVMGLESGPFLTMVTLGVAGLASFPWPTLLGAILALLVGLLVGNLDEEMRDFLSRATPVMIPFFAFALGATLNLKQVWAAGLVGIGLGLGVLLVSGLALLTVDRLCGGTGVAGLGAATTAGNAAAVPALVAAANHKYAEAAAPATVLVAASVSVTTMLAPLATAWWAARIRRKPGAGKQGRVLILADDITGAADGAAAYAARGREVIVQLRDSTAQDAEALAIDANTRCLQPEEAAREMRRLVERYGADGRFLFRKVDSTLRGHVAEELVAILQARSEILRDRPVAIFAPTLPAQGRTVEGGRLRLHGIPLEETGAWKRERRAARSDIMQMLAGLGLRIAGLNLAQVRSGPGAAKKAMRLAAQHAEVVVCDAETEADLASIASASLVLGRRIVWVGSSGLARHLPEVVGSSAGRLPKRENFPAGPTLYMVGSMSERAQEQAARLESTGVETVRLRAAALLHDPQGWSDEARKLERLLGSGEDALVLLGCEEVLSYDAGRELALALGRLGAVCADRAGALVATGGETARAVLDAWGVERMLVIGQVEEGVPLAVTEGWQRELPVVTKAGGFGDAETLVRCREFLQRLKRTAAPASQAGAKR